jgi:hypothetical protein
VPATQAVAVEETVPFAFAADKVHFFDGTTGVSLLLRDKAAA